MSSANKLLPQWSTAQHPILIRVLWFKKLQNAAVQPFRPSLNPSSPSMHWWHSPMLRVTGWFVHLQRLCSWSPPCFPLGKLDFHLEMTRFPRGPHYQTTHHYRSKIVWRATPSFKRSPVAPETWGKLTTGIGHDPMTGCMCILNISYGYTGLTHQKGWVYMITVMVNIMTCLMNFNDINNQLCSVKMLVRLPTTLCCIGWWAAKYWTWMVKFTWLPSLAVVFVPPIQNDCWVCSHPCIHARPNCYISQLLDDGWLTWWCGWHNDGNTDHDHP